MSAIPAVRSWLVDAITAETDLIGVQVEYGWPRDFGHECAIVGGPDPDDTEWVSIGQLSRDIKFTVPIYIQIRNPGESAAESDQRADEIQAAIQVLIKDGKNLDDILIQPPLVALGPWDNFPGTEGWVTQVELRVRCHARDS